MRKYLKNLSIPVLTLLSVVSIWGQQNGVPGIAPAADVVAMEDAMRSHLSLIDLYYTRMQDAQNLEKYIAGGIFLAPIPILLITGFGMGWGGFGFYAVSTPLASIGLPVLLSPSLVNMERAEYDVMPDRSLLEAHLKIVAGDARLRAMRDSSLRLRIVFGSIFGVGTIVAGIVTLPMVANRYAGDYGTPLLLMDFGLLATSLVSFFLPSYVEQQYDEYVRVSKSFR